MKTILFQLSILALSVGTAFAGEKGATQLMAPRPAAALAKEPQTFSSLDRPGGRGDELKVLAGGLKLTEADLPAVFAIYQELSGRSVVRASTLPAVKISFQNQLPLTRREALQALDTVLAQSGIVMIPLGSKYMKAVPVAQASTEAVPLIELPPDQLPESSSYMMYVVELKHCKPSDAGQVLQQFAKMPGNSIVAVREPRLLILRDYASNIRRMLQVLERMDREE